MKPQEQPRKTYSIAHSLWDDSDYSSIEASLYDSLYNHGTTKKYHKENALIFKNGWYDCVWRVGGKKQLNKYFYNYRY